MTEARHLPLWVDMAARVVRALPAGRYRAMNWVARRHIGPFVARMPSELGGYQFLCDLSDPLMREVCLTGRYEPQETALLQRLLAGGMTAVDVGANWGYFTLVAAHLVGPSGSVVTVEADPRAQHTLAWNVSRNGLASVRVVAAAAADRAGTLSFAAYGTEQDNGANFGLVQTSSASGSRRFEVASKPLDQILDEAQVERVDLLKMDIEGGEARAIPGLARRLSAGLVDRLVLELHPAYLREQGSSTREVIERLSGYGYRAWHIDHSPRTHHRAAASGTFDVASLLTPFAGDGRLGEWPHLLWAREGLDALPG
jgi:FkbM family methyltransferase